MEGTWTIQVRVRICGYQLPEVDITAALGMLVVIGFALGLIYGGT